MNREHDKNNHKNQISYAVTPLSAQETYFKMRHPSCVIRRSVIDNTVAMSHLKIIRASQAYIHYFMNSIR